MVLELASYLEPTGDDRLAQAEALVRSYCRWHIAPSREATLTVRTCGERDIFLPSLHVSDIAGITEDGVALEATDYTWLANDSAIRRAGYWPSDAVVSITFTHGYTSAPPEVTAIVQAVAQRAIQNPGSLVRRQVGPFADTYSTTGANEVAVLALLASEKETLRPYRVPVVA